MNCQRANDLFIDYLYGELDTEQADSLRVHLDQCPKCAARLTELSRVRELIASRPDPEPSPVAVQRILAHAREEAETPRTLWRLGWLKVAIPLCFMVVVGGWIVSHYLSGPEEKTPYVHQKGEKKKDQRTIIIETARKRRKEISPPHGLEPAKAKGLPPAGSSPRKATTEGKIEEAAGAQVRSRVGPTPGANEGSPLDKAESHVWQKESSSLEGEEASREAEPTVDVQRPPEPALAGRASTRADVSPSGEPSREAVIPSWGRTPNALKAEMNAKRSIRSEAGEAVAQRPLAQEEAPFAIVDTLERGEKLLEEEDFDRADEVFSLLLSRLPKGDPHRPRALLGLARAKEGLGRIHEARRLYKQLADESPSHRETALQKIRELGPSVSP